MMYLKTAAERLMQEVLKMSKVVRVIMIMTFRKVFTNPVKHKYFTLFTDSEDILETRETIVDYNTGARYKYVDSPPRTVLKAIDMKNPDFRCEVYRDTMYKLIRRWDIKYD